MGEPRSGPCRSTCAVWAVQGRSRTPGPKVASAEGHASVAMHPAVRASADPLGGERGSTAGQVRVAAA